MARERERWSPPWWVGPVLAGVVRAIVGFLIDRFHDGGLS